MISEMEHHETIYTDIMDYFISTVIFEFKFYMVGLGSALTIYLVLFILYLIKRNVTTPITRLTNHINNLEKDQKKRDLFE